MGSRLRQNRPNEGNELDGTIFSPFCVIFMRQIVNSTDLFPQRLVRVGVHGRRIVSLSLVRRTLNTRTHRTCGS